MKMLPMMNLAEYRYGIRNQFLKFKVIFGQISFLMKKNSLKSNKNALFFDEHGKFQQVERVNLARPAQISHFCQKIKRFYLIVTRFFQSKMGFILKSL